MAVPGCKKKQKNKKTATKKPSLSDNTWPTGMTGWSWTVHVFYHPESKTFLHMFEFSWWRGNSEPGTSCFLLLRDTTLFPEDTLSYMVTYSLKAKHQECRVRFGVHSWVHNKILLLEEVFTIPDREGSFVHLHAYQEGIFGKLDSGDEVERCLCFEADLHTCSHEVHVHCNVASDHQGSPETMNNGNMKMWTKAKCVWCVYLNFHLN